MLLVILATSATVIYATRTSLDVHKPVIELLHLMGAKDRYIANLFAKRTLMLSFIGGIIGLIITFPALIGIGSLVAGIKGGIISEAHLTFNSWIILIFVPLFCSILSTITAYITVKKTLLDML
jgi:cell division transport system permease protein